MASGNHEVTLPNPNAPGAAITVPDLDPALPGAPDGTVELFILLRADHAGIDEGLEAVAKARAGSPVRDALWEEATREITAHCHAEEDALYRLMSRMPHSLDLAETLIEGHDQIQRSLGSMPGTADPEFDSALMLLREKIRCQIDEEEEQLVHQIAAMFDAEELERLAERFLRLKGRYSSSRAEARPSVGTYESWPPDDLYELALKRRLKGRSRMGRAELIQALRKPRS